MFYPTAPIKPEAEEAIDEAVEAAGIIAKMEAGEDDKITLISKQLAGRDCIRKMTAVYDKVIEEQKALRAVSIAEAKTQTEYVEKLTEKADIADPAKWLAGIKLENEVETWADLKAKFTVSDVVEEIVK